MNIMTMVPMTILEHLHGIASDHVDGREARVERASIAVDLQYMWGSLAPTAIGHRPKQNK